MKITLPAGLALGSVAMIGFAIAAQSEELLVAGLLMAGTAVLTYILALKNQLSKTQVGGEVERRFADLDARLTLTEGELEIATLEIERLRSERDFDRELLGTPGIPPGKTLPPT